MQRYGNRVYSQHGEDLMLLNLTELMGISKPSYLDLGAHHPENLSNTKLLYDSGSRGINVEANPLLIQEFLNQRPEDTTINAGVGVNSDWLPFYICNEDEARSTFHSELLINQGFTIKDVMTLPIVSINKIVRDHCNGLWPDILLTDIEGMDYTVLRDAQFGEFIKENKPKIIVAEIGFEKNSKLELLMKSRGYTLYCRMICNLIFVSDAYKDLVY